MLNCPESSSITIENVSVQIHENTDKCTQTECNLNRNDHDLITELCEESSSCSVNGSLLTFACQQDDLHYDLWYICQLQVSYEYVGCFFDDGKRVLEEDHTKNKKMSADICFGICTASQKWKEDDYFGTEYAHQCFCGNGSKLEISPYVRLEKSQCNTDCLKHEDEKCGGTWRIFVYQIIKRNYYYMFSCLDMDLEKCVTYSLQGESSCLKFDPSFKNQDPRCSDFGNQLYDAHCGGRVKCAFKMINILRRSISIEYLCKGDSSTSSSAQGSSDNLPTSTVVGIVVGSVVFLCIVFIGFYIGRRRVFCKRSNEKLRNYPETNDYVGNQDIALSQAVSPERHAQYEDLQTTSGNRSAHNYSRTNVRLQTIEDKYDYANNIDSKNSKTLIDKTSTPTYVVLHGDSLNPNPESNDDEYAVVDPSAESSFTKTPKPTTPGTENYMILDPSQTGINRSKFPNTGQTYELAKPINDTRGHKNDTYALCPEGTYDHSGITRHRKDQDTIYTHAVDNVYDSASRGINIARKEDTYDHFFGKETENEYNIAMH
ncbi:Hypothetical predicted protein [Mytilus galloprovincialis]|uniref:WSC domain-containing protein n=1 Tax=Mytilus galloprovincialis TaxID=29158 RepID=A0A8B6GYI9_MYTGA|nr:Hypothetical predicted protein [Mytilus galloprovincialis]